MESSSAAAPARCKFLFLQREGGRRMTAAEFLAGHPLKVGEKVGTVGA